MAAAIVAVAMLAVAAPASAQWSSTATADVSVSAGYPQLLGGNWLTCRGPETYQNYVNSIGGDFKAVANAVPAISSFMVYRTIAGVTTSNLWSTTTPAPVNDQNQLNYMFHDVGGAFYNWPPVGSPMTVWVRPMYQNGWLGPASNSITVLRASGTLVLTCTA
ncbi:hypothetical protein OSC27_11410 [Microbacterium sp. STN6]|uniref:hypothetical protein n=1 Tax=Microbacterium sp. STN6 TaxID=2995588 RepID=UPI002260EBAE|nr:hypothetical protein [Microbacterium sp. STN6]MCX7522881.1 hypothetical protein [Microbacterium sp. STN6]